MRKIVFPIFIAAMSFAADAKAKEITEVVDSSHVYELDEVCVVRQPKEQFLLRRQGVSSTMLSAKDMSINHKIIVIVVSGIISIIHNKLTIRWTCHAIFFD